MKLNAIQIDIIKGARELFEAIDYETRNAYICIEISRFGFAATPEDPSLRIDRCREAVTLQSCVRESIDWFNSFETWFWKTYPAYLDLPSHEQYRIAYLARCAWLDRIIETGEMK